MNEKRNLGGREKGEGGRKVERIKKGDRDGEQVGEREGRRMREGVGLVGVIKTHFKYYTLSLDNAFKFLPRDLPLWIRQLTDDVGYDIVYVINPG